MKRTTLAVSAIIFAVVASFSINMTEASWEETPGMYAVFKTNHGEIVVELFPDAAPITVANFVGLAEGTKEWTDPKSHQKVKKPFYDGLLFHRVIDGFMMQGGDPMGTGMGGPGYQFEDEFASGKKFDKPGILAMANAGPNTNGSQFFITQVPTPHLNNKHTIFGEVVEGMDNVNNICKNARSLGKIVMETVTIKRVEAEAGGEKAGS